MVDRHMKPQSPSRTTVNSPRSERSEQIRDLQFETRARRLARECFPVGHLGRREFSVWVALATALLGSAFGVPFAAAQAASSNGATGATSAQPATEPSVPVLDTWGTDPKPEKNLPTATAASPPVES